MATASSRGVEICDDGNTADNDGCSANCDFVEIGFSCPVPGDACEECGDGVTDPNEVCDDANRYSGDGCRFDCQEIETGYTCPAAGGECESCGDGLVTGSEVCDDANAVGGDGCNATCDTVEPGFICVVEGRPCYECGNGVQEGSLNGAHEECDDGNTTTLDGCDDSCQLEGTDWSCPVPGQPCVNCGNGTIEDQGAFIKEQCDDGNNLADDGCDSACQLEVGATCLTAGQACTICGDGIVSAGAGEACDDDNRLDSDGCSSTCQIEAGWSCPANGGKCWKCGNAVLETGTAEQCDDGNTTAGDGCNATCQEEGGPWTCIELPGKVRTTCDRCGNGQIKLPSETCDDGNTASGDGCSSTCLLEAGWTCPPPSGIPCNDCGNGTIEGLELCDDSGAAGGCDNTTCASIAPNYNCPVEGAACVLCGDNIVQAPEVCDDGAPQVSGDGCRADCLAIEPGYVCPGGGGDCTLCGNGVLDAGEACDDKNAATGDGCNNCVEEAGWTCFPSPNNPSKSVCDPCGNGLKRGDEACDDGCGGNGCTLADNGDGCSSTCTVEAGGWVCPPAGGVCYKCGDGILQTGEECDDGANGAGCAADCQSVDANFACYTPGQACEECGDGVIDAHEVCDDTGTSDGDGCRGDCKLIEPGWLCSNGSCTQCGNGLLDGGEQCDDGQYPDVANDGCTACTADGPPYYCYTAGQPCEQCGDGVLNANEACDDGNDLGSGVPGPAEATDGCSANCQVIDANYSCPIPNIECNNCGNGIYEGIEQCDDGNATAGDGCTACKVDPGWNCEEGATPPCTAGACGDGFVAGTEECDDGDLFSGDGCSASCKLEPGYECPAQGGQCVAVVCGDGIVSGSELCDPAPPASDPSCPDCGDCGDGIVSGTEECDDAGSVVNGKCNITTATSCTIDSNCPNGEFCVLDGCNATCHWNTGFSCTGTAPNYDCDTTTCGDGILGNLEECDDDCATAPNTNCDSADNGDGCSQTCTVESFFKCTDTIGELSVCEQSLQFVAVRVFNVSFIQPESMVYDPNTRSFLGFKSSASQPDIELCLDGTEIIHPDSSSQGIYPPNCEGGDQSCGVGVCIGGANAGADCTLATEVADCASDNCGVGPNTARVRLLDQNFIGATYDPVTGNWLVLQASVSSGTLWRVDDPKNLDPTPISYSTTALGNANGIAIGDDGRLYVIYNSSEQISAFERCGNPGTNCTAGELAIGFDFTPAENTWNVSVDTGGEKADDLFNLAGYGLIGTLFDSTVEFWNYDSTGATAPEASSTLPGTLFLDTMADGSPLPDFNGYLGAGETSTDGSGFIMCASNPSEPCFLFAQVCNDNSDCLNGAECVDGGTVSFCSAEAKARDDYGSANTAPIIVPVLDNDTLSTGICADQAVQVESVTPTLLGGTVTITTGDSCGQYSSCVTYTPPPGVCNVIDQFDYTALLGGGDSDTATVFITITCDCGDGNIDPGEECEPPNTASCNSNCQAITVCGNGPGPGPIGTPEPGEECDDGNNTSGDGCSWDCQLEGCGNGLLEAGEDCDDGNGVSGDGCRNNCTIEDCPDGILDPGEQCDDGNNTDTDACSNNCVIQPICGDGIVAPSEQCDDGNNIDTDLCLNDCTDASCGDGVLSPQNGEECDDNNNISGDNCTWDCQTEGCGNGTVDGAEECDDGNTTAGDGCSNLCVIEYCGDGAQQSGPPLNEQCDDGNQNDLDSCRNNCKDSFCGDLVVEAGEQCDDGNMSSGDGCSSTCQSEAVCGDGVEVAAAGEQCDDGNNMSGDGCSWNCLDEICGNGLIDPGEECDDGNDIETDTCRGPNSAPDDCTVPRCGDGVEDAFRGEQCDDGCGGNGCSVADNGDGCSQFCTLEAVCQNGVVEGGEDCDFGPDVPGDGCSPACIWESCGDGTTSPGEACDPNNQADPNVDICRANCTIIDCGDGILDPGEQCDDDNNTAGDGCSDVCTLETICGNGVREGFE